MISREYNDYNISELSLGDRMKTVRVLIVGNSHEAYMLRTQLLEKGFICSIAYGDEDIFKQITEQNPDVALLEIDSRFSGRLELVESMKREKSLPVIALLKADFIRTSDLEQDIDDFVVEPYRAMELVIRIRRLFKKSTPFEESPTELIEVGDLVIDQAKCEVSVGGRIVILAFKEYELLKFLVNNRGRVFTRQALLDKVWGYDYFGGDRTVDVHIRRLRAKIEDSRHSFIDTVRSIGYRFKDEA